MIGKIFNASTTVEACVLYCTFNVKKIKIMKTKVLAYYSSVNF